MSSSGIATSETINSTTEWKSGSLTNVTVTKGNLKLGYVNKTANNVDAGKYANVSGGDTSYGEYITKVEIKDISHSTGDNGGYLDATNIKSSSLKPGHTYKISVRFHTGGYGEYATVAFDWNDNEDLSDDNVYKIGHCSTNGCVVSEQITVPKDINMGESTIMRVIGAYSSYHMDPTTDTTYNEQEDYSVYLPEYKSSGTHSTGWINTGRKASWHNLTYRTESINTDTQISIDIEVSNDKSNVLDSTSYLLADGKNTIDLTGLENAQYIKITADLGTSNSSDTPKLDFYEINHKLINITSTDVKNYDDKHKSNISAIAEHPSGDASFSSCKVYYKPNYKDNYKKLGSATLKNVSGPQKKACNASLSKSLDHIGYGSTETDKIDYYFIFNDTDSVKRKSAKKSLTLPNSEPAINLTDQTTSSSSHSFTFNATGYDQDGEDDFQSCSVIASDGDGNQVNLGGLTKTSNGDKQASCPAEINASISGFSVGEDITVKARFTDIAGATVETSPTQYTIPNHAPTFDKIGYSLQDKNHAFNVNVNFTATDSVNDLTSGQCTYYIDDNDGNKLVKTNTPQNPDTNDEQVMCNYTGISSSINGFQVDENIDVRVEITEGFPSSIAYSVNSSIITQAIPNRIPNETSNLELNVSNKSSVVKHSFLINWTNPNDPEGDSITVKAYLDTASSQETLADSVTIGPSKTTGNLTLGDDISLVDGTSYDLTLEACDSWGCNRSDSTVPFTMNEEPHIPEAGSSVNPDNLKEGNETDIFANVTDIAGEGVKWVNFTVTQNGENILNTSKLKSKSGSYWNSTNFTVNGSTKYNWKVKASDGQEITIKTGSFTTGNSVPTIDTSIKSHLYSNNHSFNISFIASDADGKNNLKSATVTASDGEGYSYTYNATLKTDYGGSNEANITYSNINKSINGFKVGESINIEVKVTDKQGSTTSSSTTIQIPNRAPVINSIGISPNSSVETNNKLIINYSATDPEGDEIPSSNIFFRWYDGNGNLRSPTSKTVGPDQTTESEDWRGSVQLIDEYGASSPINKTNIVTIQNTAPQIKTSINFENLTDHRFKASTIASDINRQNDITSCKITISGYGNSSTYSSISIDKSYGSKEEVKCSKTIDPSKITDLKPLETVDVEFKFTDDNSSTATKTSTTVVPNKRPQVTLESPLKINLSDSNVEFKWKASDKDGDKLKFNISVFNENGAEVWNKTGLSTESYTTTLKNDGRYSWNVTVKDINGSTLSFNSSQTGSFLIDSNAPTKDKVNVTAANNDSNSKIDQNDSITIHSNWSDNFQLEKAVIYENETDTNHTIGLNSSTDWANLTLDSSQVTAGEKSYTIYAFDHLGNMKKVSGKFTVKDIEKPEIKELSINPNSQAKFDPGNKIYVNASVSDNLKIENVKLQYRKEGSSSWNTSSMTLENGVYQGSFTPGSEENYTIRIKAEDTSGNKAYLNTTQLVKTDVNWLFRPSNWGQSRSTTLSENIIHYSNLTLENNGDINITYNLSVKDKSSDKLKVNLNVSNVTVKPGESKLVSINATITNNDTLTQSVTHTFDLKVNAETGSDTPSPQRKVFNDVIARFLQDGPYLTFSEGASFPSSVTQGEKDIPLSIQIENIGTKAANSTEVNLELPKDWNAQNTSFSIGNLTSEVENSTATIKTSFSVSKNASTGSKDILVKASSINRSFKHTFADIPVLNNSKETDKIIRDGGTTIISGGGGGGGPSREEKIKRASDQIFNRTQSFELVRGQDQNFTISFTNPTEYNLSNITIEASGFRAQYLDLKTTFIKSLDVNETENVTVGITAPDFFASSSFTINFDISGVGYDPDAFVNPYFNFTLNKQVNLEIHEISKDRAQNLTREMQELKRQLNESSLPTNKVQEILSTAKNNIDQGQYGAVQENFQQAQNTYQTATETRKGLKKLQNKIEAAETQGLTVNQARRMANLAEAALERGAYQTAANRLEEARNLYQLETKGQVNYIYLITSNWKKITAALILLSIISIIAYYRYRLYSIDSRLRELDEEEQTIEELKKEDQKKAFEQGEMSIDEYEEALEDYNEDLIDVIEERTGLESEKANLTNFRKEKALKQERKQLKNIIQNTQREYVEGNIADTEMYETKVQELTEKLSEVESDLAEIEARKQNEFSWIPFR